MFRLSFMEDSFLFYSFSLSDTKVSFKCLGFGIVSEAFHIFEVEFNIFFQIVTKSILHLETIIFISIQSALWNNKIIKVHFNVFQVC